MKVKKDSWHYKLIEDYEFVQKLQPGNTKAVYCIQAVFLHHVFDYYL